MMAHEVSSSSMIFPFGGSAAVSVPDRQAMGTKGANLVEMTTIGLPVPPGFVVHADIGRQIVQGKDALDEAMQSAIVSALHAIEQNLDRVFGGDKKPLLLSVRSSAAVSMPGMMDTVLNLGLNGTTVEALARETGDERFAWDSYRRFVQSFSQVVLGMDGGEFEFILEELRAQRHVDTDAELSAEALQELTSAYLEIVQEQTGRAFPEGAIDQLHLAMAAVFNSWNTPRARRFRDIQGHDHDLGTAAIVQAMVFGNRDQQSCTGVYFTRNPSTGVRMPYGEYMPNAQGEDVVSGIRTPMELTEAARIAAMSDNPSMEKVLPTAFDALLAAGNQLELHFRDMQEIEFTVESERLFLLQTRNGKRTPKAGLKLAVDMVTEGLISKAEALDSCDMHALEAMLVAKVQTDKAEPMITKGLPASPGAVVGEIVFTSDAAVAAQKQGRQVILVRPETDPKDVHGMHAAIGILTSRGGMTSHAAVVARGMAKPCITAAMSLRIDVQSESAKAVGQVLNAGDIITIDGGSGAVFRGAQPIILPEPDGELATLLQWQQESGAQ